MYPDNNDNHFLGRNGFYYFFGIVEDRDDPLCLGRLRVRVFGTHPDDKALVPTEDLPWAMPIQSIGSAAAFGLGHSPVGPVPGTHVFGFWADGRECQLPFVLGTIAGGTGQFNYGVPQQGVPDAQIGTSPVNPSSGAPINLPKGSKSISNRAATFAKLVQDRYKLTDYQACGLIGNLWHESGGFRAIREYGKGSGPQDQPPPKGTQNTGYGWAQWTNSRLDNFLDYCTSSGHAPQSDEANLGFFLKELDNAKVIKGLKKNAPVTVTGYWSGTYDTSNIEGSARYVMAEFERPKKGLDHIGERIQYAKMTLVAMNKTTVPQGGAPATSPNAQYPTNNNPKAK
jgi:hypothetical protein